VHVNNALAGAGLPNLTASFSLSSPRLADLFTDFEFRMSDPDETELSAKGMGIQSTALLAAFSWVSDVETQRGASPIWLIEEPESYLHPELALRFNKLVQGLKGQTAITTHSVAFVPPDPGKVVGTLNASGRTEFQTYKTYAEATASIRAALGVRFADFFNMGERNVPVEGESDRLLLQWFLAYDEMKHGFERLRTAELLDFGGVRHLAGFLRASWAFIRSERSAVALFDGDAAGQKERRDLQQYFGSRQIPFGPNQDFVTVRKGFAIEGLFPDDWIVELHEEHPNWFEAWSVDASGALEEFRVKDGNKATLQKRLMQRATESPHDTWAQRWLDVCNALDGALGWQNARLAKASA
jgi:hypothetical protein